MRAKHPAPTVLSNISKAVIRHVGQQDSQYDSQLIQSHHFSAKGSGTVSAMYIGITIAAAPTAIPKVIKTVSESASATLTPVAANKNTQMNKAILRPSASASLPTIIAPNPQLIRMELTAQPNITSSRPK